MEAGECKGAVKDEKQSGVLALDAVPPSCSFSKKQLRCKIRGTLWLIGGFS